MHSACSTSLHSIGNAGSVCTLCRPGSNLPAFLCRSCAVFITNMLLALSCADSCFLCWSMSGSCCVYLTRPSRSRSVLAANGLFDCLQQHPDTVLTWLVYRERILRGSSQWDPTSNVYNPIINYLSFKFHSGWLAIVLSSLNPLSVNWYLRVGKIYNPGTSEGIPTKL